MFWVFERSNRTAALFGPLLLSAISLTTARLEPRHPRLVFRVTQSMAIAAPIFGLVAGLLISGEDGQEHAVDALVLLGVITFGMVLTSSMAESYSATRLVHDLRVRNAMQYPCPRQRWGPGR